MWGSPLSHRCGWLVYLMHTFKDRRGTNSENNLWRNLINQQKYLKLTIGNQVLTVLLLNKNSRVVNKTISLDGEWIALGINKAYGTHSAFSGSKSRGPLTLWKAWSFSASAFSPDCRDLLNLPPAFEIFCIRGLSSYCSRVFLFIWFWGFCPNFSPIPCPSYLGQSVTLFHIVKKYLTGVCNWPTCKEALSPYLLYSHVPLLTLSSPLCPHG